MMSLMPTAMPRSGPAFARADVPVAADEGADGLFMRADRFRATGAIAGIGRESSPDWYGAGVRRGRS